MHPILIHNLTDNLNHHLYLISPIKKYFIIQIAPYCLKMLSDVWHGVTKSIMVPRSPPFIDFDPYSILLPFLLFRIWSSCERTNASQHPSSLHCGPQHEGCQVRRLPGHCAFWTASCHLFRSVSCSVTGQTACENISERTLLASLNKNTGNGFCSAAITLVFLAWWNQNCLFWLSLKSLLLWVLEKGSAQIWWIPKGHMTSPRKETIFQQELLW